MAALEREEGSEADGQHQIPLPPAALQTDCSRCRITYNLFLVFYPQFSTDREVLQPPGQKRFLAVPSVPVASIATQVYSFFEGMHILD